MKTLLIKIHEMCGAGLDELDAQTPLSGILVPIHAQPYEQNGQRHEREENTR